MGMNILLCLTVGLRLFWFASLFIKTDAAEEPRDGNQIYSTASFNLVGDISGAEQMMQ